MLNNYYEDLWLGNPIYYGDLIFYPITIEEISQKVGLENLNNLMLPFRITKEMISDDVIDSLEREIDIFDDIILKNKDLIDNIADVVVLFCKADKITLKDNSINIYDKKDRYIGNINSKNFDDIAELLLKLTGTSKVKVEKPPKNMSERQRDIWEKLNAGRQREAKKNECHFYDIMNICSFAGNYFISKDEIKNWTIWQLLNGYRSKVSVKKYDDNLSIGLASYDLKEINGDNHWYKKLMVRE